MLIITNRVPSTNPADGNAFTSRFSVGKPDLSVADATKLQTGSGAAAWSTKDVDVNASDVAINKRLAEHMSAAKLNGRRILFYVHGNSNDYLKMLERCYDITSAYEGIEVIGFSWPSEGFLPSQKKLMTAFERDMGADDGLDSQSKFHNWMADTQGEYRQARKNAEGTALAFTRSLKLMSKAIANANTGNDCTLALHSLGNYLFWQALQNQSALPYTRQFSNIVLLAPCVTNAVQQPMLDPLTPKKKVYVTFNKNDWILTASQIADKDTKLGLDPGLSTDLSTNVQVRYVDFEGAAVGLAGHRYFIDPGDLRVPKTKQFFSRIFAGEDDLRPGEGEKQAYPFGCTNDGKTCYMGITTSTVSPG